MVNRVTFGGGSIMLAAVESGDAKKVAEIIRLDPAFTVNLDQDGDGDGGRRSPNKRRKKNL